MPIFYHSYKLIGFHLLKCKIYHSLNVSADDILCLHDQGDVGSREWWYAYLAASVW